MKEILEQAKLPKGVVNIVHGLGAAVGDALDASSIDHEDLAWLDVADVLCAHDVERARLGGHHPARMLSAICWGDLAKCERPEAIGIADGDQRVVRHDDEREGALALVEGIHDARDWPLFFALCGEVQHQLGVRRRVEQRSLLDQLLAERPGVGQVAVVRQREVALLVVDHKRLDVGRVGGTSRCGVARVSDGGVAKERVLERLLLEHVQHQSKILHHGHCLAALGLVVDAGDDACGLLPAVLKGVKAEVRQAGRLRVVEDTKEAAVIARFVHGEGGRWAGG